MGWTYTALTEKSEAKLIEITTDDGSLVFVNGTSSSSKTLSIIEEGFTPYSFKWEKKNSDGTYTQVGTARTYIVAGVANVGTYRATAYEDANDNVGHSDMVTIASVSDGQGGSSPYLFSLSNENFTINTTNDLKPTTSLNYEVKVTGYHGSSVMTAIASGTPTAEQFKITIPGGSIFSLKSGASDTLVYAANTSTALSSENLAETITITYDTNKSETKTITISCAKNGISPTVTQGTGSVTITDASGHTGTVNDGHSPVVTATKSGTTTTIKVDDVTQATINDGANGVSVSSVAEYYQRTNSATAPAKPASSSSLGSWKTTVDNPISTAQYLYNCEIIKFSNNTETVTNPVQIAKYVTNGANGKGIASIQNVYKLTTNTTAPSAPSATDAVWTGSATGSTSAWGTVCPTTTTTNKYLWNVERVTYDSSPATYSVSSVKLISTHGDTGANAIVMTSASTPSGTYNGQVGIWQGQIYIWNGTQWENQTNILPTDAVLHYSFDDLPDYPDGTADVRLLNNNTYDIQSGNFKFRNNGGATISNNNGNIQFVVNNSTSDYQGVFISSIYIHDKIVKMKIEVSSITNGTVNVNNGASSKNTVLSIDKPGEYDVSLLLLPSGNYNSLYIFVQSGASATVIIKSIYIGDGSYATPIIDNANGEWNSVSQSGVAVQGVSGKGLDFPSANQSCRLNVNMPKPTSNDDFTISMWIKIEPGYVTNNEDTYKPICCVGQYASAFGLCRQNTDIVMLARDSAVFETIESPIDVNKWHLYTGIFYGDSHKFALYKDGEIIRYSRIANTPNYQFGDGLDWTLWSNTIIAGNAPKTTAQGATIDDLLIFNRALSEKEVLALYYNKANTPKFYTKADYDLAVRKYQYLGRTLYVPTSNSVTVYTSTTVINGTSASKTAQNGDFVSVMYSGSSGTTPLGKVYKFNGQSWELDSDTGHEIEAMADILMLADSLPSNGTTDLFLKRLVANQAFINNLFAKQITVQHDSSNTGYLKSSNFISGSEGWRISGDGSAEFRQGTFDNIIIGQKATLRGKLFQGGAMYYLGRVTLEKMSSTQYSINRICYDSTVINSISIRRVDKGIFDLTWYWANPYIDLDTSDYDIKVGGFLLYGSNATGGGTYAVYGTKPSSPLSVMFGDLRAGPSRSSSGVYMYFLNNNIDEYQDPLFAEVALYLL